MYSIIFVKPKQRCIGSIGYIRCVKFQKVGTPRTNHEFIAAIFIKKKSKHRGYRHHVVKVATDIV